jgi:hypothetical protein
MEMHLPPRTARYESSRWLSATWLLLIVVANSGASCNPGWRNPWASLGPPAPAVITSGATVPQIITAVNQNTARIQTYTANNATLTVPGMPGPMLQGNIAIERPQRFRLRAGTVLSGPELDLGSNEQIFWFWVKRNVPPALYYTRHDQYASSAARQVLPVEPSWLMDALGLITLDPNAPYEGPFARSDGSLELRSQVATPSGTLSRVVVIEPNTAQVLEQHLYQPNGTLVASSVAQRHRYDAINQVSLPERVSINVPGAQLALTLEMGQIVVNQPVGDAQMFALPVIEGFPAVDLSTLGPPPIPPVSAPTAATDLAPAMRSPYARFRQPILPTQPKPSIDSAVVPANWQEPARPTTSTSPSVSSVPPSEPIRAIDQQPPTAGRLPPNGVEF